MRRIRPVPCVHPVVSRTIRAYPLNEGDHAVKADGYTTRRDVTPRTGSYESYGAKVGRANARKGGQTAYRLPCSSRLS